MQKIEQLNERILSLVALLTEMAELDLHAEVRYGNPAFGTEQPIVLVHFTGRDIAMLTADNGRVLDAIENLALDMLDLPEAQRERIHFDAGSFLSDQKTRLTQLARTAIAQVGDTGTPHVFAPMNPRDRRLLEHALHPSGLHFETLGQHSTRWIILFPHEFDTRPDRSEPQHLITH